MAKKAKGDTQLGWIYEGAKALANREDYLLGKRLDKNFEMYSDTIVKEKESGIEALIEGRTRPFEQGTSKVSNLGVNIVRNEDPLVAIKVKEEKLRQEKLENPLMMLKIQKVLKEAMEKKARKMRRKEMKAKKIKKEKKRSSASSNDSKHHSRKRETSAHSHKASAHHHKHHSRSASKEEKRKRSSSNATDEMAAVRHKRHHMSDAKERSDKNGHLPTASGSSDEEDRKTLGSSAKRRRQRDSHIPEHLRPKCEAASSSSSGSPSPKRLADEAEEKRSRFRGYGLVGVRKKEEGESEKSVHNPYELTRLKLTVEPYKREERRKLTPKEMEAKRREMIKNAEWRDATRSKNVAKAGHDEEAERKEEQAKVAGFIRPMLNNAASSMTVERQLSSHRQGLQRSHGYMEEKFANRR
ncbi:Pre-mRNA-splicing factor CWC25 -like protein [Toxocara canis]|uniref:Pre-mRNA-splicing factor CWC25-like protein n=1 Tax=Toxocara canis TaxID=6265 RepID=A0A0B2V123_TOXCA|nr:Pre-mRNA-splicing factor CWC25 -like protein [Toxocara canis]